MYSQFNFVKGKSKSEDNEAETYSQGSDDSSKKPTWLKPAALTALTICSTHPVLFQALLQGW